MEHKMPPLTPAEKRVLEEKYTERPFTGKYMDFKADGTYVCRKCGQVIFDHRDKFDSRCGWPSFDRCVKGAVIETPDADGIRTEVVCTCCGGHLGHVFRGEGYTPRNTRYCINSISMSFIPDLEAGSEDSPQKIVLASGCFWGTQYWLSKIKGVLSTRVGYAGGWKKAPLYQEVYGEGTGHRECVEVLYDPHVTDDEEILRVYFNTHDPTQASGQGADTGYRYTSAVFYTTSSQRDTAERMMKHLRDKGINAVTELRALDVFYPEKEAYHDMYYDKRGMMPYCHVYREII